MNILAIDSSSQTASCAVVRDGALIAECFQHTGLTHSATLVPLMAATLETAGLTAPDIGRCAVTVGPGSFTGLRIGLSACKGFAFPHGIPCVGVSTLHALAHNLADVEGTVVACLDARRDQVYAAAFDVTGGVITRRWDDEALVVGELAPRLFSPVARDLFLVGDGAALVYERLRETIPALRLVSQPLRYVRAASVAGAAKNGEPVPCGALRPAYLRLPQAERERLIRQGLDPTEEEQQ